MAYMLIAWHYLFSILCFVFALTWTLVLSLWKELTSTWNQRYARVLVHLEFLFNLRSVLLVFQPFIESLLLGIGLLLILWYYFIIFGEKPYGSRLCDMQINYEMVTNAQVLPLTVSLLKATLSFVQFAFVLSLYWRLLLSLSALLVFYVLVLSMPTLCDKAYECREFDL